MSTELPEGPPSTPPPPRQRATTSTKLRPKQRALLEAYAVCGNLSSAADLAKVSRSAHYEWLEQEPMYAAAFEEAENRYADQLRDFAKRRAIDGVPEPIIWQGEVMRDKTTNEIITVLKRSDRLLEVLLKAKCPEFREKTELTGANGAPVQFQVVTGVPQPKEPDKEA